MIIIIEGHPVPKQRPRHNGKVTYTPKKTKDYEELVRVSYIQQSGMRFTGSLRADITIFYPIPKSWSKKKKSLVKNDLVKPVSVHQDLDNVAKSILDALNGTAYDDDKQICLLTIEKRYTDENERVELHLEEY